MHKTHNTVYHPACTAHMGPDSDPTAVVDPRLRVRGVRSPADRRRLDPSVPAGDQPMHHDDDDRREVRGHGQGGRAWRSGGAGRAFERAARGLAGGHPLPAGAPAVRRARRSRWSSTSRRAPRSSSTARERRSSRRAPSRSSTCGSCAAARSRSSTTGACSTCSARASCSATPRCCRGSRPGSRRGPPRTRSATGSAADTARELLGAPAGLRYVARSLLEQWSEASAAFRAPADPGPGQPAGRRR